MFLGLGKWVDQWKEAGGRGWGLGCDLVEDE